MTRHNFAYHEIMNTKEWFQREKYVALHAQPIWFRILKWIVILSGFAALWSLEGWMAAASVLLCLMAVGTILHFLLRWENKRLDGVVGTVQENRVTEIGQTNFVQPANY